jgi:hypothetical protein
MGYIGSILPGVSATDVLNSTVAAKVKALPSAQYGAVTYAVSTKEKALGRKLNTSEWAGVAADILGKLNDPNARAIAATIAAGAKVVNTPAATIQPAAQASAPTGLLGNPMLLIGLAGLAWFLTRKRGI